MKSLFLKVHHVFITLAACAFIYSSCQTKKSNEIKMDTHNGSLVDSILNQSNHNFVSVEKGHARFYYEPDTFFNNRIDELKDNALLGRDKCIRLLGDKQPDYTIRIIYFNDREKLRPFVNMAPKGIALPDAHALLIATNDSTRAYHTHEMMHIISINQFGGYAKHPSDWIQEGIAVYADSPCMNFPIHAVCAYLFYTNKIPTLDALFYRFRSLPDMLAYMVAGSVSQFIIEKYGRDKFEQIWKQGAERIPEIIGKSTEDLEDEYLAFLQQQYPHQPDIDWELLDKVGCG